MKKNNLITRIFQSYLINVNIKTFKGNFFYYLIFRFVRLFLNNHIEIKVEKFKILASHNKNKTSYFLLKKCYFGDDHELNSIKKFSALGKVFLLDCGSNYGYYSFYTASLSNENKVIAFEASKMTSNEFQKNLTLNNFNNIKLENLAVSSRENEFLNFIESDKDWESSLNNNEFINPNFQKVKTTKIDYILKNQNLDQYFLIIKLDIEGNELDAIKGSLNTIKKYSPIIIIEFSKYNLLNIKENVSYLSFFLAQFNYSIYGTNKKKITILDILDLLKKLKKKHQTIGNYYLIKNSSKNEKIFLSHE